MRKVLYPLTALALVTSAAVPAQTTVILPASDPATSPDRTAIDTAAATIKQGRLADAITGLDPVIAHYDHDWRHSPKLVFSARSMTEAILYAGLAAAGKIERDTVVLGPEWLEALQLKAYALVELKRINEALPLIEKAAALAPMNSRFLRELGYTQGQAGQAKKALAT